MAASKTRQIDIEGLPGADRVQKGLVDLQAGRRTVESLLLSVASERLRQGGLSVPEAHRIERDPDLALYRMLEESSDDPYFRYNSLRRELDSFLAALDGRRSRASRL